MSSHVWRVMLSALADGELSAEERTSVNAHLAGCAACTSEALSQSLLKLATARAGHRYKPAPDLQHRMARLAAKKACFADPGNESARQTRKVTSSAASLGWLAAAAVLLMAISIGLFQHRMASSQQIASLMSEVCDQHIAALATGPAPQVISTDRHTVKPWFQGKIPFSFGLPEALPGNTTLDGANLTYIRNQPVAQLLFSIGKHRVSVFVRERSASEAAALLRAEHYGFHVESFATGDLEGIAVSDVDPARLGELVTAIRQTQTGASTH